MNIYTTPQLASGHRIFILAHDVPAKALPFKKEETAYLMKRRESDKESLVHLQHCTKEGTCEHIYVQHINPELPVNENLEKLRRAASKIEEMTQNERITSLHVTGEGVLPEEMVAFLEGLYLSNYNFDTYKSKKILRIEEISVDERFLKDDELQRNVCLWNRICMCRDWVNRPVVSLNAATFAAELEEQALAAGVTPIVFGQKKIESLKMGGLLAVNKGSVDEARFVVLDYKPDNAINQHPIALVGKGVMYDTGGLNLKPGEHMRDMKTDMAGAATMASVVLAAADNKLPIHVMAFLPLTDSRPGKNAYVADDIITMYDGTTVEVVDTDAEGRLILADAIAYANQYDPELIVDCATLTGACVRAIGSQGIGAMAQQADGPLRLLQIVGDQVYERLAIFPFWKEYDDMLKSNVADLLNCSPHAGCITAGKFLAHFAKHPFIHLDIAGVAFFRNKEHFHGIGASGFGVRLLYAFLQTYDIV